MWGGGVLGLGFFGGGGKTCVELRVYVVFGGLPTVNGGRVLVREVTVKMCVWVGGATSRCCWWPCGCCWCGFGCVCWTWLD